MNALARNPDDAGRLVLALLLALGLHAALLFGIPADWWSIRRFEPLRFDVVLLPPVERSRVAEPASSAPARPETDPGNASALVAVPESIAVPSPQPAPVAPPQPAPVAPPEPVPIIVPPPIPTPPPPVVAATPAPSSPPQPALAPKPTSKPAAPAKPLAATKIAPAPRTATKSVAPPKPAKPPEKTAPDSSKKPVAKPREAAPPPIESSVPVAAKPAPATTAPEPARPARRSGRSAGSATSVGSGSRGRLDSGALLGQIAGLEAETQRRANAGIRSKRVSPNDTQSLEGFYIAAWVRKVEQIGETNFPEVARKSNLSAGPVLDVAIRADGTLKDVRIARSSGNAELDQAAQRIVRLGAPYAPFSAELRQRYDVLLISRPWRFEPGGRVRSR